MRRLEVRALRAVNHANAHFGGEGASVLEARNDLGQTIRGLLLLGIFVVLPVTAAVFPALCRTVWPDRCTTASAMENETAASSGRQTPPAMSIEGRDADGEADFHSRRNSNPSAASRPIVAEVGSAGMAELGGGSNLGSPFQEGASWASNPAIATPGNVSAPPTDGQTPWADAASGASVPAIGNPSMATGVEGWPDRGSVGPGYAPRGLRDTPLATEQERPATPPQGVGPIENETALANLQQRLQARGAVYYRMEHWGNDGRLFRFYCDTAVAGQPGVTRHWEAISEDPNTAMLQVLSQIEAAGGSQGSSPPGN